MISLDDICQLIDFMYGDWPGLPGCIPEVILENSPPRSSNCSGRPLRNFGRKSSNHAAAVRATLSYFSRILYLAIVPQRRQTSDVHKAPNQPNWPLFLASVQKVPTQDMWSGMHVFYQTLACLLSTWYLVYIDGSNRIEIANLDPCNLCEERLQTKTSGTPLLHCRCMKLRIGFCRHAVFLWGFRDAPQQNADANSHNYHQVPSFRSSHDFVMHADSLVTIHSAAVSRVPHYQSPTSPTILSLHPPKTNIWRQHMIWKKGIQ